MENMLTLAVARSLTWLLARVSDDPKRVSAGLDVTMSTLNRLWQTQAVHEYLDGREQQLKDMTTEAVLRGQIPDSKFMAGRIAEIRALRDRLKAAHVYMEKLRSQQQPKG